MGPWTRKSPAPSRHFANKGSQCHQGGQMQTASGAVARDAQAPGIRESPLLLARKVEGQLLANIGSALVVVKACRKDPSPSLTSFCPFGVQGSHVNRRVALCLGKKHKQQPCREVLPHQVPRELYHTHTDTHTHTHGSFYKPKECAKDPDRKDTFRYRGQIRANVTQPRAEGGLLHQLNLEPGRPSTACPRAEILLLHPWAAGLVEENDASGICDGPAGPAHSVYSRFWW